VVKGHDRDGIRELAEEGGVAWLGDDSEELAEKAGIDPDGLRDTISRFNDAVRRSEDPLGRDHLPDPIETPPFYAVLTQGTTLGTHGGIAVDENRCTQAHNLGVALISEHTAVSPSTRTSRS
jgi:fumarate reductase flavoprotein subunit